MNWDKFNQIAALDLLAQCSDCHCIVVASEIKDHEENCLAYFIRWKEEYDAQLGASEIGEDWVDREPPAKIQKALEFIKNYKGNR